jgi:hypothetical protein
MDGAGRAGIWLSLVVKSEGSAWDECEELRGIFEGKSNDFF